MKEREEREKEEEKDHGVIEKRGKKGRKKKQTDVLYVNN